MNACRLVSASILQFAWFVVLALGLPQTLPASTAGDRTARPNILLITADDLGEQLSCYGEKRVATPKLDALAAEGVRFANAYCSQSSCSSARSSLLTGRWPHQNGQIGLAHLGFRMHPGQTTLPAALKKVGYRTGIIGKLHVSPGTDFPFDWMPTKERMEPLPTRDVAWVAAQSREFFADVKRSNQPFFYYVNYMDPHDPLDQSTDRIHGLPEHPLAVADVREPLPFAARTEAAKRAATAHYLNAVLRLDAGLGLLLDELKAAGFADNTIVIYLGDNGIAVRRGKTTSYEWGGRVPLLVRWPGMAKAGQVRPEMVTFVDVMPTLLEAAGAAAPKGLEGVSLTPLLRGESPPMAGISLYGNELPRATVLHATTDGARRPLQTALESCASREPSAGRVVRSPGRPRRDKKPCRIAHRWPPRGSVWKRRSSNGASRPATRCWTQRVWTAGNRPQKLGANYPRPKAWWSFRKANWIACANLEQCGDASPLFFG